MRIECPRVLFRRALARAVALAYLFGVEVQAINIEALDEPAVGQRPHVAEHRRANLRGYETRKLPEIGELLIEDLARLLDRDADTVERLLSVGERLNVREVEVDDLARRRAAVLLPLKKVADKRLETPVDATELRETADKRGEKTTIGEQIVDKGKYVVGEVDCQLPRVFQTERFLVPQRVIADRVGWDVSLVDRFHHLLIQTAFLS